MPTKKPLAVENRKPKGKSHSPAVDWEALLARIPGGEMVVHQKAGSRIFRQGDPADALFYLRRGKVKLSVTSEDGKEAIIAILDADEFFGEGCLAGQPLRMATATAMEASALTRIPKPLMARMLHVSRALRNCSSPTCCTATSGMKRISSISSSTPVNDVWPGFSCY